MIVTTPILKTKRSQVSNPVFTILVPSWNNLAYLQLCIESLRKNSALRHQVVVHINEGKDGTLDWVRSRPDLDYTYSGENIGICYALNAGRELADASYILYMNDDMYVCPGWDQALYDEIKKIGHNYFFLSATMIEPYGGNPCVITGAYGTDRQTFREEKLLQEYADLPMHDWQGATWPPNVVHRELWDLVGGYSVEFSPGMYSDPDFSMKLWISGVRLFKGIAASRVYHFGKKSTGRVNRNDGHYTFPSKWGMSSNTLTKCYLRRGEPFDGPLQEPHIPAGLRWKNLFKRLRGAFRPPRF